MTVKRQVFNNGMQLKMCLSNASNFFTVQKMHDLSLKKKLKRATVELKSKECAYKFGMLGIFRN